MPLPYILVVDDEPEIRKSLAEVLRDEGYTVSLAANAAEAHQRYFNDRPDLVLLDIWMPGQDGISLLKEWAASEKPLTPVIMMSGHGTIETAVEATRLGALEFLEKPLALNKLLTTVRRVLQSRADKLRLIEPVVSPPLWPQLRSLAMRELRARLEDAAANDRPVMLYGEQGSGREHFARVIHSLSARANDSFIVVSSVSLSSEHVRIQLCGDDQYSGYLAQAGHGFLYLGDIQYLPRSAQRLLEGILASGEFFSVKTNVSTSLPRLVCSSIHLSLLRQRGAFDLGLLSRLEQNAIEIPSLRAYREDVPELLRHYSYRCAEQKKLPLRQFSVAAQNRLRHYDWPGNLRELETLVNRLLSSGRSEIIELEEVERTLDLSSPLEAPLLSREVLDLPLREARERFEKIYLQHQLAACGGKVGKLAEHIGVERTHLYRKLRSLGVPF